MNKILQNFHNGYTPEADFALKRELLLWQERTEKERYAKMEKAYSDLKNQISLLQKHLVNLSIE